LLYAYMTPRVNESDRSGRAESSIVMSYWYSDAPRSLMRLRSRVAAILVLL